MTIDRAELEARLAQYEAEHDAWVREIATFRQTPGREVMTGSGVPLIVAAVTPTDGVRTRESILLTQDGGIANTRVWHDGPSDDDVVYVERWEVGGGRVFHGYVDRTSRKLVQTG